MSTYRKNKVTKWDLEWYQKLSTDARSVFDWLYCKCDWAGFYKINLREMVFKINLSLPKLEEAINECSKDLIVNDGWIWVTEFLTHQKIYPKILKVRNNFYNSIIELLGEQHERFPQANLIMAGKLKEIISPQKEIIFSERKNSTENIEADEKIKKRIEEFKEKTKLYIENNPKYKPVEKVFVEYWTELNESCKKFRYEEQKFFDLGKRLGTFLGNNENKYGDKKSKQQTIEELNKELLS